MEQWEFLMREAVRSPEMELKVRAVFAENTALKDENAILKERLAWFEKQVYGQKSEKTEVVLENAEQLPLFDEAEQIADVNPKNPEYIDVKASKRIKRTRGEIYADLEVEEVYHEVEDKTCDKCGAEMTVIGKEKIRDELRKRSICTVFWSRGYPDRQQPCGKCGETVLCGTEELAVFRLGERSGSQCDDVFRCGNCLCERDESGGVSYDAV